MVKIAGKEIKTMAYMPLHYGAEYFVEACRSVMCVDELLIIYTDSPSYGQWGMSSKPPGENKQDLYELFKIVQFEYHDRGKKARWAEISNVHQENKHRQIGIDQAKSRNFDILVAVDSDEIWDTQSLMISILEVYDGNKYAYQTNHQGWRHYYRSFNEYCQDGFQPVRLFNLNRPDTGKQGIVKSNRIYHMGYAIKPDLMKYKLDCHGHKSEINKRGIENFFNRWKNYSKSSWENHLNNSHERDVDWTLHPTSKQVWFQTKIQDKSQLPIYLKEHEYFDLDKIE